jgi:ATP-dependent Lhr-like helicase
MVQVRWRWNAARALAVPRFRRGRRTPAPLARMLADDLLSLVFPDQAACAENLAGDRQVPDHPLVSQTVRDCLEEAMDVDGFLEVLRSIERGELRLLARDLREPSPLSWEVLTVRPYGYLDDAPLEERRTQAVINRRFIDPKSAADLGALDAAAIERVRREAWPEARDADELHEALVLLGAVNEEEIRRVDEAPGGAGRGGEGAAWPAFLDALIAEGRAAALRPGAANLPGPGRRLFIAAERLPEWRALLPGVVTEPPIEPPAGLERAGGRPQGQAWTRDEALVEILRGRLEASGPTTAATLAASLALPAGDVAAALVRLETEGFVLRGRFTPGIAEMEWCARRLLARIHRQTLERLRREIEPVSAADFLRFLFGWQHVEEGARLEGPAGTARVVEMLEGYEAAAGAWERSILPARVETYDPSWLDALCLSGRVAWGRLRPPKDRGDLAGREDGTASGPVRSTPGPARSTPGPVRSTPVALLGRARLDRWWRLAGREDGTGAPAGRKGGSPAPGGDSVGLSSEARAVADILAARGALFYPELAAAAGLLPVRVEAALGELVGAGLVTSDGFSGLRSLILPAGKRGPAAAGRRRRAAAQFGLEAAGRWSLLRAGAAAGGDRARDGGAPSPDAAPSADEAVGLLLLKRYGVVFRKILEREPLAPRWRDLLVAFRRLEARGDIRGGRFVDGFSGEQFALPEAITRLREVRRRPVATGFVVVSAADPLNLVGILTPGAKIPPVGANRILYLGGVPVAVRERREVRFLTTLDLPQQWRARRALLGPGAARRAPAALSLPA